ncbi:ABC transporter permease [Salana multivorans]
MSAWVVGAELDKLRTLPIVVLTVVGTIIGGIVLGAALAASAHQGGWDVPPVEVVVQSLPFVQVGMILLGVLPVAQEYAGSQVRTSLTAVPHRGRLLAAKSAATVLVAVVTAAVTVAVTFAAALLVVRSASGSESPARGLGVLAGAVGYLVLIAMLAYAIALQLRHLVPALVTGLALVVIASPVLAAQTELARWLPDRAAQQALPSVAMPCSPR